MNLQVFVLGNAQHLAQVPLEIFGLKILKCEYPLHTLTRSESPIDTKSHAPIVLSSAQSARFARLLNIGNGLSYGGGMGMPEWVMLDCALIPSFFVGFCLKAKDLPHALRTKLTHEVLQVEQGSTPQRVDLEQTYTITQGRLNDEEWVPVSEFCAIPTFNPQEVMGYSLFSLLPGLGKASKALGLACYALLGAKTQLGVAQYTNIAAMKSHLSFGPLMLVNPMLSMHTKAGESMMYRLTIPSIQKLEERVQYTLDNFSKNDKSESSFKPQALSTYQASSSVLNMLNQERRVEELKDFIDGDDRKSLVLKASDIKSFQYLRMLQLDKQTINPIMITDIQMIEQYIYIHLTRQA